MLGTLVSDSVLGPLEVMATDGPNAITLDNGPDAGTSLLTVDHLLAIAKPSDVIITQCAGSVWKVGEEFLSRMAAVAQGEPGQ